MGPKNMDDGAIVEFMIEHLETEHQEDVDAIEIDDLREMIGAALVRAQGHGFSEFEDVVVYMTWMFVMAPNFDAHPKLAQVLANKTISAKERIQMLLGDAYITAWEEAEDNYDEDAWFPETDES